MIETWMPVVGWPAYKVSDHGRIMGLRGLMKPYLKRHPKSGRPVCMVINIGGRSSVKTVRVHRLVLEAFIGPAPAGTEGCHEDGDPTNNFLSNLRWDTHIANQQDMEKHGTKVPPPTFLGEQHHATTITESDVRDIRLPPVQHGLLPRLSRKYDLSVQTIWRIRNRKTWKHVA